MKLDARFRSLPSRSARALLLACCLGLFLSGAPLLGAGTPAAPPPGTGGDARWNASSSIKPALIMEDFTWFAGHSDPDPGEIRQFYALDIENGILFAATGQGLQIVDVTGGPTTEEDSFIYGWHSSGSFPGWQFAGDADWFVKHLDAPAGNPNILALSMDIQGFAIVKTANPASPAVAYHAIGANVNAGQVYSARAAGTDWAYLLNTDGQVVRFNLTAASSLSSCLETPPATTCPNVYKGIITSMGSPWLTIHGTGNFLATGKWIGAAAGPVKIWSLTDPAAPSQVLQIDGDAMGVAMWQSGGSYYLARIDPSKKLSIHDVSCIAGGACSSAPVVWSKTLTSPSSLTQVTVSQTGGRTYLYVGGDDFGSCAPQREYLFDVTTPATASQDDLTPKINAAGYWGWYYQACPTGFTLVGPRIGKVYASSNGTHLYRAANSILDAHTVATQGPPTAGFTWSPSEIYPGTPVQFTDQSSGQPTSWTWNFQDGTPSPQSGQTPSSVTFSTAGQKTVTLDVANQFGPGTPASQSVTVIDPAPQVAGVTVSPSNPVICQPITFTATGVTGQPTLAYSWAIPGAVPTPSPANTNPLVWNTTASTTPNTYTATVTVSNGAGSAQKNVQVAVGALQPINPTYTPTNDAFTSGTVKFHDNQTAGSVTEWSWDFDDAENGSTHDWTPWTSDPVNGPSPTHTYADTGTKQVFVRVRNCTTPDQETGIVSGELTINIAQITPLVASFQANMLCPGVCFATAGIPVPFVDASTGAEFWDYSWDGDDVYEDANNTTPRLSHTYSTAGTFTPKLKVRRGTEFEIKVHDFAIQVSPASPAGISISGPSSGNVNASLTFTASGTGSCSPASNGWTWSLAGGTATGSTTGNQVTVSWSSAGGKTLTATNSACSGATGTKTVTISSGNPPPPPPPGNLQAAFSFTPASPIVGQAVSFNGSASTGSPTGYAWDFGDGTPIGSGAQVSHTYATAGVYLARLSVSKESTSCPPAPFCESTTTKQVVVGTGQTPLGAAFDTSATCVNEFSQIICTAATGQQVTFTDRSLGSPTSWSWSFGDGGSATGQQVTHVFTNPGSYTVTLTAGRSGSTDSTGRAFNIVGNPPPKTIVLPWIAQTRGALLQSSDLYLHNPGTSAIDVTLEFRKRGVPEANPPRVPRTIQPGATLYVADVLRELFNRENVAGFISVTVDEGDVTPVITSFNTTFQADGKQFGQTVAGVPMGGGASAEAQAGNQVEHLVGLIDNGERLAYFGISNPSDEPALYHLRFFDKEGRQIGESDGDFALSRFGQRQFQVRDIHDLFGISNAADYRVEIENKTGAHVIPYASNLRLSSEDPSFIKPGSSANAKVYLIGVLSQPGLNDSLWQTDALLTNIGTQAITADVTFTNVGLNGTTTSPLHVTLAPGTTERLENVVASEWGINNAIGVLTVTSTSAGGSFPVVQGESYDNTNPAKRFGQSMTAVSDADAAEAGETQLLVGLRQDAENRTVFWIFNNGSEVAEYDLIYRRLDGTPLGNPVSVRLGAGKMRQFSPGQHPLPTGGVQDGFTVQIKVKSGKVLSAAQVINNLTNDPAYIQGEVR